MTSEQVYEAWAPPGAMWSAWAKPVLFACVPASGASEAARETGADVAWAPRPEEYVALVLDLPGAAAVGAGLELARRGYWPVPLYNALPGPLGFVRAGIPGGGVVEGTPIALVDVHPIVQALARDAAALLEIPGRADSPPAFLLDANRRSGWGVPAPNRFDNRSLSFPTDFPSAHVLLSRGIRRALLVQSSSTQPQPDLAHTLRRWQEGGVAVEALRLDAPGAVHPCDVAAPSGFRKLWYRALEIVGLTRGALGGFGGMIPEPSSG